MSGGHPFAFGRMNRDSQAGRLAHPAGESISFAETFMDSDGSIGSSQGPRNASMQPWVDRDGSRWHNVVLTTLPAAHGYAMYLDGELAARMDQNSAPEGKADGGDPIGGGRGIPVVLCGRADDNPMRRAKQFPDALLTAFIRRVALSRQQDARHRLCIDRP